MFCDSVLNCYNFSSTEKCAISSNWSRIQESSMPGESVKSNIFFFQSPSGFDNVIKVNKNCFLQQNLVSLHVLSYYGQGEIRE